MFKQGQIVKSTLRTVEYPLYLMVLEDKSPSDFQFNGVILKDGAYDKDDYETKPGYVSNSWNTHNFKLSSWSEFESSNIHNTKCCGEPKISEMESQNTDCDGDNEICTITYCENCKQTLKITT